MYIINKTNGNVVAQIADGATNTSTSLTLVGRNYVGYGELLQENLVKLLENFARNTAPPGPLVGQLWFDTAQNSLKVYTNSSTFRTLAISTASSVAPANAVTGNFWYDTNNNNLKVYDGAAWALIGPKQGANVVTLVDTLTNERDVVIFEVNGNVVGILNDGVEFTPLNNFYGFSPIKPGLNLTPALNPNTVTINGTAANSAKFNGLSIDTFLRTNTDVSLNGNLAVRSHNGLWLGGDLNFRITNEPTQNTITFRNFANNGNFVFTGTYLNNPVALLTADVTSGLITVNGPPVNPNHIATKDYVDQAIVSNIVAVNNTIGLSVAQINATQTNVVNLTATKAPIVNPSFTGAVVAPTLAITDSSNRVATTLFVKNLINSRLADLGNITVNTLSTPVSSVAGRTGDVQLTIADVSGAAPVESPTFTGNVLAPNLAASTNSSAVATTAFVQLQKISPAFLGNPTAVTQAAGTNNSTLATTAFVTQAVNKVSLVQTGYTTMRTFTSSTSWAVPIGVTKVKVTVVGGGGNGGDASTASVGNYVELVAAGGGGGGGTAIKIITGLTPGQIIPITVGNASETSSFGAYCYATGGASAAAANGVTGPTLTDGANGGIGVGGDLNIPGGRGQDPELAGNFILYRQAGNLGGGTFLAPYNSTGYGAGGAGRMVLSAESQIGGPGRPGVVIVEY